MRAFKTKVALGIAASAFSLWLLLRTNSSGSSYARDILTAGNLQLKNGALMQLSQNGLDFIKKHEGFSAKPYRDAAGYSVGFGHFILPNEQNLISGVNAATAENLLRGDVAKAERGVNAYVKVPLSQNAFDALVSFAYNVGVSGLARSDVVRRLNAGDKTGAAASFGHFITSQKIVIPALVKRRQEEAGLFLA